MKKFLLYVAMILLLTAGMAAAADELIEVGADYRVRYDILDGTVHDYLSQAPGKPAKSVASFRTFSNQILLDRLGINLKANAAEDLTVMSRLDMYKVWGHQTMNPVEGNFFEDRAAGPFDGTIGHVPTDTVLRVDYAYATLNNIGGAPVWISAGRRPTTGGAPTHLIQDLDKRGPEGTPAIMADYAFDGLTLGFSPAIDVLPGAYAKISYGKGFDSGFNDKTNDIYWLKDEEFLGLSIVPYDTNNLYIDFEVQKAMNLIDRPSDIVPPPNYAQNQQPIDPDQPLLRPSANVGNITWFGGVVMGMVADLNLFASGAMSKTNPNDQTVNGAGLLWDGYNAKGNRTGTAIFVGGRYDIKSMGTKIGLEYNQGSKYWMGMVPAEDDVWTGKLGTRGNVVEVYVIQELKNKPLMKKAKAFWKLGYQSYKFDYTGSNSWIGAPVKISELNQTDATKAQYRAPLQKATDLYVTFEVLF